MSNRWTDIINKVLSGSPEPFVTPMYETPPPAPAVKDTVKSERKNERKLKRKKREIDRLRKKLSSPGILVPIILGVGGANVVVKLFDKKEDNDSRAMITACLLGSVGLIKLASYISKNKRLDKMCQERDALEAEKQATANQR